MDVTIDAGVSVEVNGGTTVLQIWDGSLPITLQPGKSLVLAETANYNFDTSDFGLGSNAVVKGTINAGSLAFAFEDTGRILYGHDDAVANKETTPYGRLGMVVPEPSALVLVCGSLLGLVARRRRIA